MRSRFGSPRRFARASSPRSLVGVVPIVAGVAIDAAAASAASQRPRQHRVRVRQRVASTARPRARTSNAPIVGMATTPNGKGYWLVANDGGVFAVQRALLRIARRAGTSTRRSSASRRDADGKGYWLVAETAACSPSATRKFYGSTGAMHLNSPDRRRSSPGPLGKGYWLMATDGGVFTFGTAKLPRLDRR